jgi:hypothetical protein
MTLELHEANPENTFRLLQRAPMTERMKFHYYLVPADSITRNLEDGTETFCLKSFYCLLAHVFSLPIFVFLFRRRSLLGVFDRGFLFEGGIGF